MPDACILGRGLGLFKQRGKSNCKRDDLVVRTLCNFCQDIFDNFFGSLVGLMRILLCPRMDKDALALVTGMIGSRSFQDI